MTVLAEHGKEIRRSHGALSGYIRAGIADTLHPRIEVVDEYARAFGPDQLQFDSCAAVEPQTCARNKSPEQPQLFAAGGPGSLGRRGPKSAHFDVMPLALGVSRGQEIRHITEIHHEFTRVLTKQVLELHEQLRLALARLAEHALSPGMHKIARCGTLPVGQAHHAGHVRHLADHAFHQPFAAHRRRVARTDRMERAIVVDHARLELVLIPKRNVTQ